jgi:hypothetical protein
VNITLELRVIQRPKVDQFVYVKKTVLHSEELQKIDLYFENVYSNVLVRHGELRVLEHNSGYVVWD